MSKMIFIGKASLYSFEGIREGMRVEPKELSISGEILNQSKHRHARRRECAPPQEAFYVFNGLNALCRYEKQ